MMGFSFLASMLQHMMVTDCVQSNGYLNKVQLMIGMMMIIVGFQHTVQQCRSIM